jgi:hypothetical protein
MRVTIRQPLHPFIKALALELGIQDDGEVVNYILLKTIEKQKSTETATAQNTGSQNS